MSFVVVKYQYSTSSDRVLNRTATWKGEVPGRSLATVMSLLRRVHPAATNIAVAEIEWRGGGEAGAVRHERRADWGGSRGGGPWGPPAV